VFHQHSEDLLPDSPAQVEQGILGIRQRAEYRQRNLDGDRLA